MADSSRSTSTPLHGALPAGSGNRRGKFEIYDRSRFLTLTGNRIADLPRTIDLRQAEIDAIVLRMLPPRPMLPSAPKAVISQHCSDAETLERGRAARNGDRFRAMYDHGDLAAYDDDHSRADLALVRMLAYWCDGDRTSIDRLFRASALMRGKWDSRRGGTTYGEQTISRALA